MLSYFDETIKKIRFLVNDFIKEIDDEIAIKFSLYSKALFDDKIIFIGLYPFEKETNNQRIKNLYIQSNFDLSKEPIDIETFTLLHEIGHTQKLPTTKMYNEYIKKQNEITKKYNENEITEYETLKLYGELEPEKLADNWAIKYYKENKFKVILFDRMYIKLRKKLLECE